MADDLKTLADWLAQGRSVRKGEHAEFYLTNGWDGVAVFRHDQTQEAGGEPRDYTGWKLITREEWNRIKEAKKERRASKIIVRPAPGIGAEVWAGSNAKAIDVLKRHGWKCQPNHYWFRADRDATTVADTFEANGFRVERHFDLVPV